MNFKIQICRFSSSDDSVVAEIRAGNGDMFDINNCGTKHIFLTIDNEVSKKAVDAVVRIPFNPNSAGATDRLIQASR